MANSSQAVMDQAVQDISDMDDVVDSAIALIGTLVQAVKDAGSDPTKLAAALSAIEAKKQALADAVAANTPAAPSA